MRGWGAAFVLVAITAAWACGDDPVAPMCAAIPAGGCPSSIGPACNDPSCASIYACVEPGSWRLLRECPARDAGADASTTGDAASDAPLLRDVQIDVPGANGGPGCGALEPPDCMLGFAAACPVGCCGCEDLFVCGGGSWNAWGTSGDGGALVPAR